MTRHSERKKAMMTKEDWKERVKWEKKRRRTAKR